MTKVFVICRDRLEPLLLLLPWIDHMEVTLLDNNSSYEPLLEFYSKTDHKIIRLETNQGHISPWTSDVLPKNERFIITDPDIVPIESCPKDYVHVMNDVLNAVPIINKVGFGLKIDDLPDHYKFKNEVISWEQQFWSRPCGKISDAQVFDAPVDTTFALYRENSHYDISQAARLGEPYMARHLAWYSDSDNPTEEEIYYKEHTNKAISSWMHDELSPALQGVFNV